MKIIHYINNLGSGGAEKLLTDILPEMKKKGHNLVLIYSNSKNNVKKFEKILQENEIKIYDLKIAYYNPIQIFYLLKIFLYERPQIVHAHLFPTQYWLSLTRFFYRKPCIFVKTEHNISNSRRKLKFFKPLEKLIYSNYDGIIGITESVSNSLGDWIGNHSKIKIIKNGVNINQIKISRSLPLNVTLKNENFNVLMVGSFANEQKDQKSLILSLEYLPSHVHIYFAGEGRLLSDIKKNIKKKYSSQIHFLGLRDDIYTIMSNVDLNVLSTNYEGMSGVTLESLASGKPFIGSDVPGVNDIVPSADFLFAPQNPKEIAFKIRKIMENSDFGKQLVLKGFNYVKKYDTRIMVTDYLNYYKSMLK